MIDPFEKHPCAKCGKRKSCKRKNCDKWLYWFKTSWRMVCNRLAGEETPKGNTKRNYTKRLIEYDGKAYSAKKWAEITGIPPRVIFQRIYVYGWSVEDALTLPILDRSMRRKCKNNEEE